MSTDKSLQARIQQERLRALGQMARRMAHDLNNAISPVCLYTDMLLEHDTTLSSDTRGQLEIIRHAVAEVAKTVDRMREFYRPRGPEAQLADIELNALARQVIDLTPAELLRRRGITIELQTAFAAGLPMIRGAELDIRDALTRLLTNAIEALPGGGRIEVRTAVATQPGPDGAPERWVRLEVRDSGIGMDEETRSSCLEPFFSTRSERGTGLGLALVYGMTQRHLATLEIDSEPGKGCAVRLLFPVSETARAAAQSGNSEPATTGLRILVVDDDPMLSQSLRNVLQTDGHEVSLANSGRAGINTFRTAQQAGAPFNAVITDLGMPEVDGREVARAIRTASAAVPIIMLTGWGRNLLADTTPPPEVDKLLNKPPRLSELRAVLAELTAR